MTVPLVHWEGTSVTLLQLVTLWREYMDLVSMLLEVSHSRWSSHSLLAAFKLLKSPRRLLPQIKFFLENFRKYIFRKEKSFL